MGNTAHEYQVGQVITIPACNILGVPEEKVTVVECTFYGYLVKDKGGYSGPVDFNLRTLQDF